MSLLIRLLINAAALWVAAWLIDGITFTQPITLDAPATFLPLLGVALVFGVVNAIVRPILGLLTLPIQILTLGLFTFVLNAVMLLITSWLAGALNLPFHVDGFIPALLGSLIISIVSVVLNGFFDDRDE